MHKIKKLFFQIYIAFIASILTIVGIKIRYYAYKPLFKNVEGNFYIDSWVTILGFENIKLKKDEHFMKNSYVYAHDQGSIVIGNNFTLNTNSQLGASFGKIAIGNNCAIASNCVLIASNHAFDNLEVPFREQGHTYGDRR